MIQHISVPKSLGNIPNNNLYHQIENYRTGGKVVRIAYNTE